MLSTSLGVRIQWWTRPYLSGACIFFIINGLCVWTLSRKLHKILLIVVPSTILGLGQEGEENRSFTVYVFVPYECWFTVQKMKIFFEKDKDIRRGNGVMVMIFFFFREMHYEVFRPGISWVCDLRYFGKKLSRWNKCSKMSTSVKSMWWVYRCLLHYCFS